ncbi:MAG TPA: preprotein translocase subunit SecG [Candidatus Spyradenecus faecavium]|uniref:Protein-export membrane protein SecG n=1 Tax=Candidatus Spyradenecus faecavium TaxID=2840947 RepID=A0A9D1NL31_9BACT|nr:preprotein translocase subunit SecG [Candidatus Spyradenecus faecavium]
MDFLFGVLLVLEALIALLMVAVVMLQPPKDPSGGMGSAFGGGFGEEVFGGRTGNVLSRATVVLGVLLILNTLGLALLNRGANASITGLETPPAQEQPAQ